MYQLSSSPFISIHAPTRGATVSDRHSCLCVGISIHAPTRGATLYFYGDIVSATFQSTLPREERRWEVLHLLLLFLYFNPRSHERSDKNQPHRKEAIHEFQSTLPREERLFSRGGNQSYRDFNPRSHERSDSNIAQKICLFLYNTDNKYIIR